MKTISYLGWAIDTHSKEGHNLLGRYWWFQGESPCIPPHMEGHHTALFKTRALGRQAVANYKAGTYVGWPNATVVHVKVTIEQVKP